MAITFPAAFQVAVSDNPSDLAAGFLAPSRYNQGCSVAGLGTNQLLYSTGATTLAQSANLTFDGTKVTIANSTATGLVLDGGSPSTPSIAIGGATDGFYQRYASSINVVVDGGLPVEFSTTGGEGVKVNSATAVSWSSSGIGGASDVWLSRISAAVVGSGTTLGNSLGSFQGKYKSSDGTAGVASFGPAAVASITVKDGIITAIS